MPAPGTLNTGTQTLGHIKKVLIELEDGQVIPAKVDMTLLTEISFDLDKEGIVIMDRGVAVGFGPDEDKPASMTFNGHYLGGTTRAAGSGEPLSLLEFLDGRHAGACGVAPIGDKFTCKATITILDPSKSAVQDEKIVFDICEISAANFNAEPGTNKMNLTLRNVNSDPSYSLS